ncbi:hypothetical protein [Planococcus alpniumensis]|uniref:hypothetical protein n=1 Tax=Planococcus alpniumensis TaxID=2708345 RepID=UPI001B8AB7A5|nr:hypothetical protein [Planococcus sp. MSAK28401]
MRQAFFLAHCKRPAQSRRRLLGDEIINEQSISLTILNKHPPSADEHVKKRHFITHTIQWNVKAEPRIRASRSNETSALLGLWLKASPKREAAAW